MKNIFYVVFAVLITTGALNALENGGGRFIEKKVTFVKVLEMDEIVVKDKETGNNVKVSLECIDEKGYANKAQAKKDLAELTKLLKESTDISIFMEQSEEKDYYETFEREVDGIVALNDKDVILNQMMLNLGLVYQDYDQDDFICTQFKIGKQ